MRKVLSTGSVEDRTYAVLMALQQGWDFIHVDGRNMLTNGQHEIIVPRDVMEYMVDQELIEFERMQ